MQKRKMVIHCASGMENSGDEAILQVLLRRYTPEFEVAVISLCPEKTLALHGAMGIRALGERDAACRQAIAECDVFILGGGGLLQDKTTIFNPSRWLAKLRLAQRMGKTTCLYANSVGELRFGINRRMAARALKKVHLITLRDALSAELLERLGVAGAQVTADPAFSLEPPTPEEQAAARQKYDLPREYVCIAIRHWYDTNAVIPVKIATRLGLRSRKNARQYARYTSVMAEITQRINDELGLPAVFLSMCRGRDAGVARDILAKLPQNLGNFTIDEPSMTPQDALAVIGQSKLLLGMRLHSLIYAADLGVPMVPIVYQDKVAGLAQMLGAEAVHVDTMDADALWRLVQPALDGRAETAGALQMQEKEQQNARLFAELMQKGEQ
ncbi:polysaccharide pyruvyl transferase family protein [Christensenellaceae bacterium 44-20]